MQREELEALILNMVGENVQLKRQMQLQNLRDFANFQQDALTRNLEAAIQVKMHLWLFRCSAMTQQSRH